PVVAEPLPLADDLRRRCRGQRFDGRPALEPGLPARDDAVDLGLLRHHLRDEDRVWVAGLAPRQIASETAEPSQKAVFHEEASVRTAGKYIVQGTFMHGAIVDEKRVEVDV